MTQKEFKKLKFGDKVLLHGGLQGKVLLFVKLKRRMWLPTESGQSPDGIFFQSERPGLETDEEEAFYIHRVGIRSKI